VEPSEVRTRPEELADLVEEWRRLAAGLDTTSYFVSPDWVLSWWETLGAGRPAEVAIWRGPGGALEAVVALARTSQPLHRRLPVPLAAWTNLGSGPGAADHCGWPVRPERADDVRRFLAHRAAAGPLLLRDLDPELGVPLVPATARRVASSPCPRLDIPADGQEPPFSSGFRKQLRAYGRKLDRRDVKFRWVGSQEVNDDLLETLFHLHERRWSASGRASSFGRGRAGLHRRLIARAGPGRGPAMVLAEQEGRPVGALYGFCWRDVFAYYQTGWEPEWAAANLGTVLVSEAVRLAGLAGARVFDFLRGADGYKYRFGASDRTDETWLVPRGLAGRALDLRYRLAERRRRPAASSPTG
jgi:CelD/BcsL family acetyltransferase involved in cellulose biosynthesis